MLSSSILLASKFGFLHLYSQILHISDTANSDVSSFNITCSIRQTHLYVFVIVSTNSNLSVDVAGSGRQISTELDKRNQVFPLSIMSTAPALRNIADVTNPAPNHFWSSPLVLISGNGPDQPGSVGTSLGQ